MQGLSTLSLQTSLCHQGFHSFGMSCLKGQTLEQTLEEPVSISKAEIVLVGFHIMELVGLHIEGLVDFRIEELVGLHIVELVGSISLHY
jgi:hypothetical protein